MINRLFYPLDRRQQTLLLSMLSFGSSGEAESLLSLLPDHEAQLLHEKIEKLAEIPKEKRVPLMVHHLKQLMSFRAMKGLDGVETSWLIAGFRGESPRTVAIVLMHIPSSISRQIVARLPDDVRNAMPSREQLKGVPMELVKLVRARFDQKFASMPSERIHESFGFQDVLVLNAKELVVLIRRLGLDELATAFFAVGRRALAAFLTRLPPENAEELMAAVKRANAEDQMELKAAQAFLGRVLKSFSSTDELFQKAGIYRLARAVAVEDRVFVRQLCQRFPRAHGRLLDEYVGRVTSGGETIERASSIRIRDAIVDVVIDLSNRGKVDAQYGAAKPIYEGR